jgi:hypothetical protein
MFPAFVPLFVFKIKSPVPCVVRVAFALLSPICTVSAPKLTSPVPFGIISISAFDVETMSLPFTSKLPPNCGEVSPTKSATTVESKKLTVLAE